MTIKRTTSINLDFQKLVKELDKNLSNYYKEELSFYDKLNTSTEIRYAVVVYNENKKPIACGGIKQYSKQEAEIKRMFVQEIYRGKGIAGLVLNELEAWSKELYYKKCILETLKEKPYAIKFYIKNNYKETPNFGEYITAENSICFEKELM